MDTIKTANAILEELNLYTVPINVKSIANFYGIYIKYDDLGESVSGLIANSTDKTVIGININQSEVRQRFTIAHELGHYILHSKTNKLFVTQNNVKFRNEVSSTGENIQEIEANRFAAALLMPKKLLVDEISKLDKNLTEEKAIRKLAKIFNVSSISMTFRIANLSLL